MLAFLFRLDLVTSIIWIPVFGFLESLLSSWLQWLSLLGQLVSVNITLFESIAFF